jgi:type I restriction enzyme M protein
MCPAFASQQHWKKYKAGLCADAWTVCGAEIVELDDEMFEEKVIQLTELLDKQFEESDKLQQSIKNNLGKLKYGLNKRSFAESADLSEMSCSQTILGISHILA